MKSGSWSSYVAAGALGADYNLPDEPPPRGIRIVNVRHDGFGLYIGRRVRSPYNVYPQSPWANPFRIGRDGDRDAVLAKFEEWARHSEDAAAVWIREHLHELADETLGCWCAPEGGVGVHDPLICHGQILGRMYEEAIGRA